MLTKTNLFLLAVCLIGACMSADECIVDKCLACRNTEAECLNCYNSANSAATAVCDAAGITNCAISKDDGSECLVCAENYLLGLDAAGLIKKCLDGKDFTGFAKAIENCATYSVLEAATDAKAMKCHACKGKFKPAADGASCEAHATGVADVLYKADGKVYVCPADSGIDVAGTACVTSTTAAAAAGCYKMFTGDAACLVCDGYRGKIATTASKDNAMVCTATIATAIAATTLPKAETASGGSSNGALFVVVSGLLTTLLL